MASKIFTRNYQSLLNFEPKSYGQKPYDLNFFYLPRTWDNERHMKRMEDSGVFQSARPTETPEWVKDYETEVDQAINALKGN
jgi:hypothetical protein